MTTINDEPGGSIKLHLLHTERGCRASKSASTSLYVWLPPPIKMLCIMNCTWPSWLSSAFQASMSGFAEQNLASFGTKCSCCGLTTEILASWQTFALKASGWILKQQLGILAGRTMETLWPDRATFTSNCRCCIQQTHTKKKKASCCLKGP